MNYRPSRYQQEFHALTVDEALGGGSAGPGKSLGLLMDPLQQVVVEHERCKRGEVPWGKSSGWALHLRREFPRLEQTIHRSKTLFPQMDAGVKWDVASHKWTFSSGYQYQFGHLRDNDSFLNYRSNEYTHLGIDELGEIDHKDTYDELVLRVRSTDPVLSKMLKVRAVTNPCANWVRDYFVRPNPEGREILRDRVLMSDGSFGYRTRVFLPARLSDNPDPEFRRQYELSLRSRPPHIRAALLDGNWYVIAGAFFADIFDPARVVIKPFKIERNWRRGRSMDWGWRQPTAVHWFAVTPDNEIIIYRERTYNGPKARERLDGIGVANRIKEVEMEAGEWDKMRNRSRLTGPADTNIWAETGHRGPTIAHDFASVGVHWQKASKGRRMCAQQVIKRLGQRGYNDRPGLMFFEECKQAIDTIPALPTDDSEEANGEVPKKCDYDHWYDSVSYICAANPVPSGNEELSVRDDLDERPVERQFRGYI